MAMTAKQIDEVVEQGDDPVEAARSAGLRHVSDSRPGIARKRAGRGFTYLDPAGAPIRGEEEIARIRSLAVPPAWTDVWICSDPAGHLQATGRDARGRKQYRYHPAFRNRRERRKFDQLPAFGHALGRLRRRIDADLRSADLGRDRVLAAVVSLLDLTYVRIGNESYVRDNRLFGL